MKIVIPYKVDKYLSKQSNGDPKGVRKIRKFLKKFLESSENPTLLPNCKKCKALKMFGGDVLEIIAEVMNEELTIKIIEITTRENAY